MKPNETWREEETGIKITRGRAKNEEGSDPVPGIGHGALAVGCGSEAKDLDNPNGYNSIKFAMAVNGTDTQIDTRVANKFKELVEEASGGVITVDVFPNDQLAGGNASKGIEMISDGSVDMAAYATSVLSALGREGLDRHGALAL